MRCCVDAILKTCCDSDPVLAESTAKRTTLNLAEDELIAARNIAQREKLSLGDAVSELIRHGITPISARRQAAGHVSTARALCTARSAC